MNSIKEFRQAKDAFFAHHPQSPLNAEQKDNFDGLRYFSEDPDLRLELEVDEFEEKEHVQMQTSTGDMQEYVRYGKVKFDVNGDQAELTLYANEHGLFLPFVDSQAGSETYGAGRYLEPEPLPNGRVLVDFNLAYNPYCAYNERWSCPLPPAENRLDVPIRAGEKNFHTE
jgi:uncharacterized protein (DUF1684 family)